jgi:tRNA pseudouridine38-40 synthase
MIRNIKMVLAYDGAGFHGWQRQPNMRTVQGCLETAVARIVRHPIAIIGAGRTDAGVHARGQTANFLTTCAIPTHSLFRAIGARIPMDMTIEDLREAPLPFHAQFSALRKRYRYRIFAASRRPVGSLAQRYAYHFWHPLDVDRLRAAAAVLVGTHDFTSFASKGNERIHNVRRITQLEVSRHEQEIRFDVEGTGFLYNQVRNMVGTLLEIGRGHWPVERMAEILAARDRSTAGHSAPAHGLCMMWILYDLPGLRREEAEGIARDPSLADEPTRFWNARPPPLSEP